MRRPNRTSPGCLFAALALPFAATPAGFAQDAPGGDRAGKERTVDAAPADPRPAPGTVYQQAAQAARPVPAGADAKPDPGRTPVSVVGSHQIDRYDAIAKLRQSTQANPKALADWIILGEIAHEVAMDAPADQAGGYFTLSRDAFEKAQALDPNNRGLKAAVQFAKDQQANSDSFEKSRDAVTDTFLDARRRDLAATGNVPVVQVYGPTAPPRTLPGPDPSQAAPAANPGVNANTGANTPRPVAVAPAPAANPSAAAVGNAGPAAAANYGAKLDYSAPLRNLNGAGTPSYGASYQPFATPDGVPFTYQQYNTAYYPTAGYGNTAAPPMTLQRYTQQILPNAFEQQMLNRANSAPPR